MKYTINSIIFFAIFGLLNHQNISAQQGTVVINQDSEISELLELKKQVNKSGKSINLLTIQIYSGNRSGAENAKTKFLSKYGGFTIDLSYETPFYRVRAGRFKSRLEADRALLRFKREFSGAFILNPKKG
jgi:hypothetical protein